jgi:hypothetical protein
MFFLLLLLSLRRGKLHEYEAAWAMLFVFLASAIIVEISLPRREIGNSPEPEPTIEQPKSEADRLL